MVVAPSRVNVYDVGSSGIGVIEGRRPLDGLPCLVQLKRTASQRWAGALNLGYAGRFRHS